MQEQCKGITKSGNRCKITVGLVNGYCRLHVDQDADAEIKKEDEEPEDAFRDSEDTVTDVASDINSGVSTILLLLTALLSIIIFWFFKKRKKRKK